jgi:hypothetical protein
VALVGGSPLDVKRVARHLGAASAAAGGASGAQIRVTFVDAAVRPETAAIAWDSIGGDVWEVLARRGSGRARHIRPLVRLRALVGGALPLHAAVAVNADGHAILVTGAAGSGKTRLLLSVLDRGWSLVAGEWVLIRDRQAIASETTMDLRVHHLRDLQRLKPRLPVATMVRERVARLSFARRLDRFELGPGQLGARAMSVAAPVPISRLIWSVPGAQLDARESALADVLDELVASQLWRYSELVALHDRATADGAAASPLIPRLEALIRQRISEHLADLPVEVVEHPRDAPLADLGRLAARVSSTDG